MSIKWSSEERDQSPTRLGDKIDLLGSLVEFCGNIITVIGFSTEIVEIEAIEEQQFDENGEPLSKLETDIGFVMALLGAIIITFGDAISAAGIAIQIKDDTEAENKLEKENQDRDAKMEAMENQITQLQNEVRFLMGMTDSLQRELAFLQKAPKRYFRP